MSEDGHELFVEGTVWNRGSRPSREVKVWVEALDANGSVIARADALPTPQAIPVDGSARFLVRLANDPAIRSFHVEAIGR
ncbi:MAG: FxLYD domain-containing protein [Candidatus Binatia bacterium]